MSLQAILFDLDGVLVESRDAWFLSLVAAGRTFGGVTVTRADFDATFGQGSAAEIALHGLACTTAELDRFFLEIFPRHLDSVTLNPGAQATLARLREAGLGLALTTNTVTPLARAILERFGLFSWFDTVACADQVAHAKPAPDMLRLAMERLGVAPEGAWMVGDSRYDAEAAAAAGVRFVGFRREGDLRVEALSEIAPLALRTRATA